MKRPGPPLFLERETYRRRRAADAARLLPVVGALLFLLPLLWGPQDTPAPDTARGGLYIFLVWGGLIIGAFALSRRLAVEPKPAPSELPDAGGPGEDRPGEDRPGEDRPGEDRPGQDVQAAGRPAGTD